MTSSCPDHLAQVIGSVYHRPSADRRAWVRVRPLRALHEPCQVCGAPSCWEVGA